MLDHFDAHAPTGSFDDLPRLLSAERGVDGLVHFARLQRVFLEHIAPRVDLQLRRASLRLEFHLRGVRHLFYDAFDLFGNFLQHVEVVAEDLHRQFGFGAFEHFVEAHFNGLGKEQGVLGVDDLQPGLHLLAQLRFVRRAARALRPVGHRLIENVDVAFVGRHRVGRDFARADVLP